MCPRRSFEGRVGVSERRAYRLLSGLVVAQIALSLALLVTSALFLARWKYCDGDPGLRRPDLTASVGLNIAATRNAKARKWCAVRF